MAGLRSLKMLQNLPKTKFFITTSRKNSKDFFSNDVLWWYKGEERKTTCLSITVTFVGISLQITSFTYKSNQVSNIKNKLSYFLEIKWLNTYNHFHIILRPLMYSKVLLSPQVKQSVIITNKRGIYKLSNDL